MSADVVSRRILLLRHGQVQDRYRGVCYGRSDVELSDEGRRQTTELAERVSQQQITHLFHSGLTRARELAEAIAIRTGMTPIVAPDLQEFNFGDWELHTWSEIFAQSPKSLDRLLAEPEIFAPPGGETMGELRDRMLRWYQSLPACGLIVAAAHGGSIAALVGTLRELPVSDWPGLVPSLAGEVELREE